MVEAILALRNWDITYTFFSRIKIIRNQRQFIHIFFFSRKGKQPHFITESSNCKISYFRNNKYWLEINPTTSSENVIDIYRKGYKFFARVVALAILHGKPLNGEEITHLTIIIQQHDLF